jgi:hypothetical protein
MFVDAAAAILSVPIDVDAKAAALSQLEVEFAQASRRRYWQERVREAESG